MWPRQYEGTILAEISLAVDLVNAAVEVDVPRADLPFERIIVFRETFLFSKREHTGHDRLSIEQTGAVGDVTRAWQGAVVPTR